MEFTLKGALKKYRRMRGLRLFVINVVMCVGLFVPWFLDFSRTETLIGVFRALTVAVLLHLEMRLKVIQIRLAGMADELDALRGKEDESNLVLELNDW